MIFRVVRSVDGPPRPDVDSEEVWSGGYQAEVSGDEALPASILASMFPELEIGTWYNFSQFKSVVENDQKVRSDIWTSISINLLGATGKFSAALEIGANDAALMIAHEVVSYCENVPNRYLWIRIE